MKPELVRHLLHRHRLQVFDPLCKEVVLRSHNDICDSLDRFLPLFERLHQSVSARDLRPDVRADILRRIRILQQFQIILRNAQMRNMRIIGDDLVFPAVLLHTDLRHQIHRMDIRNQIPGTRIELLDLRQIGIQSFQRDPHRPRELRELVPCNLVQMVFHELFQLRRVLPEALQLNEQALPEIAGADSGRIERLHQPDRLLRLLQGASGAGCDIRRMRLQISRLINSADHRFGDPEEFRRRIRTAQLLQELFLHGDLVGNGVEQIGLALLLILRIVSGRERRFGGRGIAAGGKLENFCEFLLHVIPLGTSSGASSSAGAEGSGSGSDSGSATSRIGLVFSS